MRDLPDLLLALAAAADDCGDGGLAYEARLAANKADDGPDFDWDRPFVWIDEDGNEWSLDDEITLAECDYTPDPRD